MGALLTTELLESTLDEKILKASEFVGGVLRGVYPFADEYPYIILTPTNLNPFAGSTRD